MSIITSSSTDITDVLAQHGADQGATVRVSESQSQIRLVHKRVINDQPQQVGGIHGLGFPIILAKLAFTTLTHVGHGFDVASDDARSSRVKDWNLVGALK